MNGDISRDETAELDIGPRLLRVRLDAARAQLQLAHAEIARLRRLLDGAADVHTALARAALRASAEADRWRSRGRERHTA